MINVFGIRHHGPGSARSLLRALKAYQPDCLLIEGPADAQSAIRHIGNEDLQPPVAIILYNPKDLAQASYFPFAEFSPEWQAVQFGLQNDIPVELIDLPMAQTFGLNETELAKRQIKFDFQSDPKNPPIPPSSYDPLGFIAHLAGYTDSERWWEVTFEQAENESVIFDAILNMVTALREELQRPESALTLIREAHMRKAIRKANKNGFARIAMVCGAWHAPVLHDWQNFKQKDDNALLRGIKKVKTQSTWIPWSYERLARRSGYGAGVISPAWYELLFQNRANATLSWMSQAAKLLRDEGLDASSAEVIDAIQLARTLATMRERTIAGLDELREAAVTVLCKGQAHLLELIEEKLVIGNVVGNVPENLASALQQDFEKNVKSARLTRYYKSSETVERDLDLRVESNLLASQLLHRLRILDIPWGTVVEESPYQRGSFRESWQLKWQPEYILRLIEAGMLGNTVYEAATLAVINKAHDTDRLADLTELAGEVLLAELPEAVEPLMHQLADAIAVSNDVFHLMDALEPLVRIIRYGNIRKTDADAVQHLVDEMVPRICIGLPDACRDLDEDLAQELFKSLIRTHQSIALLADEAHTKYWFKALANVVAQTSSDALLHGACTRLLFDKSMLNVAETARKLQFALSNRSDVTQAVRWLEGFLHGSGLLLIHNPALWQVLDGWVDELDLATFEEVLPLLRRAFAQFTPGERERMLQLAANTEQGSTIESEDKYDPVRAAKILPTVQQLLGLAEN